MSTRCVLTRDELQAIKDLSETLYRGGLTPAGCAKPEALAVRIIAGQEVGLSPIQSVNWIMVVNGRTCIWGDGALSLVRASGLLEFFDEGVEGDGDDRVGWCKLRRKGEQDREKRFSVGDAVTAKLWGKPKTPWEGYANRMLHMRPRGWLIRDVFADVMCGLSIVEEELDATPATQANSRVEKDVESVEAKSASIACQDNAQVGIEPITRKTLDAIGLVRGRYMRRFGVNPDDKDAVSKKWKEVLSEFGVASATKLAEKYATELLAKMVDESHKGEIKEVFAGQTAADGRVGEPAPPQQPTENNTDTEKQ